MVICKFYRQGICRFGQYCQFEHVNHFGSQASNAKVDYYNEDEIAVMVAKEVLLAERGGQWLLSCFAPLKERPSIPGMEDLSPEEVRWEMYQAQKSGMVEQAKLHFQQLCQDMKAKRDALKNPNRETAMMLKKLLGSGQKGGLNGSGNATGKSSSFSFAAPQLALANNTSTNNVFGKQSFSVQSNNPFSGGFNSSSNTLFGSNNNGTPIFGGTPTFVNNLGFGATTNTSSIFGGTTNTSTFNNVQNTSAFGVTPQTNSIFGGPSQNIFGQSNVFGGTNQLPAQSTTSTFDNNATSPSSLFNVPITSQANTPLFGGTQTTTTNLFGSSPNTQTNSGFGVTTSGPFSNGMFSQSKTLPAFGGAPVFGGVTNYANNTGTIFGTSAQTFGTNGISNNIFGTSAVATSAFGTSTATTTIFGVSTATTTPAFGAPITTTNSAFGTPVATTTPTFGVPVVTTTQAFGLGQQPATNTFGTTVSTSNAFGSQNTGVLTVSNNTPFGEPTVAVNSPFVTSASSQFGSTSTTSTPFAAPRFGMAGANTNDTFGTAATSSNSLFANTRTTFAPLNATGSIPSPFSTQTFGNLNASPFGVSCTTIATMTSTTTTTTTTTTTRANPFAPQIQQNGNIPFGSTTQNHLTSITGISSPFVKTLPLVNSIIDDSIYTVEGSLTDDEKKMFLADKFIIGKIPLKPPTKDIK